MHDTNYVSLLVITVLAVTVPLLSNRLRRLRIPIVVGEILAGIAVGRHALDLIEPSPVLLFLKELGFVYLMFLSGLEVDFRVLTSRRHDSADTPPDQRNPLPLAIGTFSLTLVLAYGLSLFLEGAGMITSPLLMSLILGTTSLGIVLPVLKEKGILGRGYGQHLLVAALVADFATLALLTVVIAAQGGGAALSVALLLLLGVCFALSAKVGKLVASVPVLRELIQDLSHATAQIQVRGALALMVGWVVVAEGLGVEMIVGAFLAGTFVGITAGPERSLLRDKLDAIGFGFFIPIFFVLVGAEFDLTALVASGGAMVLVPVLLIAAYGIKLIPSLLFTLRFSVREALSGGVLLSSRLSLIIAASAIALELGSITPAVNSAVILVAIVTSALSPMLFDLLQPTAAKEKRDGVIIAGTDDVAKMLARRLARVGVDVVVVGDDDARLQDIAREGVPVVDGDPRDLVTLGQAGAARRGALIALCSSRETRLGTCQLARESFGIPVVVARASSAALIGELLALDVQVVRPALATVVALEGALRFPTAFEVLLEEDDGVEVGEAVVRNLGLEGLPLSRIRLPGNALVVGIRRAGTVVVPQASTTLHADDHLALVGCPESVRNARDLIEV